MLEEARRLARRWKQDRAQAEARRSRAQNFAGKLAEYLGKADPSLRVVLGFGSTFETWRTYRMDSDIDLALVGGDWSLLWSLLPPSEFSISLIELDLQPGINYSGLGVKSLKP